MSSLFERLGGEPGVASVVTDFYRRISTDELLGPWFTRADGEGIQFHLRAFLAVALGGPEEYEGRSLRQAHSGLKITGEAWVAVVDRLASSLRAAGVDEPLTREVVALIEPLRAVIVEVPAN